MNDSSSIHQKRILPLIHAVVFSCLMLSASTATALEFFCEVTGDERFIRVELPGQIHLCEVTVTNRVNERRVMWYANNDSLFCSAKAYELRDKYIDQWGFECSNWPDTDGIDDLSARQRNILDQQLKALISEGRNSVEPFTVVGVKAAASSLVNNTAGAIAFQFFLSDNTNDALTDRTYVILDDTEQWRVLTQLDKLATLVDKSADYQVSTAIVASISEAGAIEIATSVKPTKNKANCQGSQVLLMLQNGDVKTRTPHRYVCS